MKWCPGQDGEKINTRVRWFSRSNETKHFEKKKKLGRMKYTNLDKSFSHFPLKDNARFERKAFIPKWEQVKNYYTSRKQINLPKDPHQKGQIQRKMKPRKSKKIKQNPKNSNFHNPKEIESNASINPNPKSTHATNNP